MKTRYFFPLAAIVLLAGCAKEVAPEVIETPTVKTVLQVGIAQDTKTSLGASENGERKVYWSNGDQILVNGNFSDELENIPDNTSSVSFSFTGTLTPPYKAIYPAGIYSEAIDLPTVQTYKADGFADEMFPMVGYSADGLGSMTMSHVCAIVKISVLRATADADEDDLVSVRFKGRNSERVSGIFTIDFENATITPEAPVADENKVVKVVKSQATSTSVAAVYYIVVPAGTYSNGFDIIVQDKNGHIMTKSKTSSWTAVAGKQYNMPEFDFVPTGTELGVEISSAQELIQFATDYNNKVYDNLGDEPLIATVTNDITFVDSDDPSVVGSWAAFNATGGFLCATSED